MGVVAVLVFVVVNIFFHRAQVTATVARYTVPIAETFEASPDGVLLSFMSREESETVSTIVPRTGSQFVEDHAQGTVTIFNAASTGSQRFITNTRFETPAGLVYRIKSPVVVPGYTTVQGKKVPGQVDAVVYADEAGEKYNGGETTFTLPGLKGSPQYEGVYAKSTSGLTGGFVGERAVVDKAVREEALITLKQEAYEKARVKLKESISSTEVLFADSATVTFVEEPDVATQDGATVSVKAVARGPVFDEAKLAAVIAQEGAVRAASQLGIENVDSVVAAVEPSATPGNIKLTLSGDVSLVGEYDRERFRQDLAGKDRRSVSVVLSGYPAITDVKVSVYPFWRGRIPEDVARITVVETVPGGE